MRFTQAFEITQWEQAAYDEAGELQLGRARVGKTFGGGELDGTSSADGDLTGVTGTVVYEHDEQGARITVDYDL
ncbi:hypothetical protein [Kribbella sp. NPDC050470]|uniref:hypothetical protein n=1 Tax=unclassified Kribbella TaxID=2644121 RepID=UPI003790DAAE